MHFSKIQRALDAGLFERRLCEIPAPPRKEEVGQLDRSIGALFREEHRNLLLEWGGANLEEIRIAPVDKVRINDSRVVFADDHNGFIFEYDMIGAVFANDTDGGRFQRVAGSIKEFINEVLLGYQAVQFYGEDWALELKKRKMGEPDGTDNDVAAPRRV